jgi:hypothetical protein
MLASQKILIDPIAGSAGLEFQLHVEQPRSALGAEQKRQLQLCYLDELAAVAAVVAAVSAAVGAP